MEKKNKADSKEKNGRRDSDNGKERPEKGEADNETISGGIRRCGVPVYGNGDNSDPDNNGSPNVRKAINRKYCVKCERGDSKIMILRDNVYFCPECASEERNDQ